LNASHSDPLGATSEPGVVLLRLKGVQAGYVPGRPILRGLDLALIDGECCAILGPSGSGKTTLLRAILGLVRPERGSIRWPLANGGGGPGGGLGYIPQNLGLVRNRSVRDNVLLGALGRLSLGRTLTGRFPGGEQRQADRALERVGLGGRGRERIEDLSGGERRRVAIARALLQQPRLLLADEFLAELDRVTAAEIISLLQRVREETAMTLLCVEHNIDTAIRIADRLVVLVNGRNVRELDSATASPAEVAELFRTQENRA
jgi:phosphonate transport system ATP-binding protein